MAENNNQAKVKEIAEAEAKAKEIAEKEAAAKNTAADIIAEAEAKAKEIVAAAKGDAEDLVSKGVSAKSLIKGYNEGLSHLQLAAKYFGSSSEENVAKVHKAIDKHFGIAEEVDAVVTAVED